MRYTLQRGLLEVRARTGAPDTVARFPKLTGHIDFDPDAPGRAAVELIVDLRILDTGERLASWTIKGAIDADAHPTATFTLSRVREVREETAGRFVASAVGQLRWRGRAVDVQVTGRGTVDRGSVDATARFTLDVRQLGVEPPKLLLPDVDGVVAVAVSLRAIATR